MISAAQKLERKGLQIGRKEGLQRGLQKGILKGRQEGRQETAKKLLAEGLSIELVVKTTGLSLEQVRAL